MLDLEREELEGLAQAKGGKLLIDDVVEQAKPPRSALHKHFNWDNRKAAHEYRRQQARALLARIRITVLNPEPTTVRAFVSLAEDRRSRSGYTLIGDVLADELKRKVLLDDILKRVAYWREQSRLYASAELNEAIAGLERAAQSAVQPSTEARAAA